MRNATSLLAVMVCLAAPLVAEAGPRRGGGMRVIPQRQAYKKPQTITPNNPAVVQAQLQHLNQLKADLDAIGPKATPSKEQKATLYRDLIAVVNGSSKPAPATVQRLTDDLANMMSRPGKGGAIDTGKLAQGLKVVMNSAYVTSVTSHAAARATLVLMKSSGTADSDAQAIADDLKAISTQAAAQGPPGMIR